MAVVKSYQSYRVLGEPYINPNGKSKNKYIKVQKDADSPIKEVRWYSDAEYKKKYGAEPPSKPVDLDEVITSNSRGTYYSFTLGECSNEEREEALGWLWTYTFCPTGSRSWWLPNYVDINELTIPKGVEVAEK